MTKVVLRGDHGSAIGEAGLSVTEENYRNIPHQISHCALGFATLRM